MLVPDRANGEWQEVMETRYYLYQVHTSVTFLHTPSLAAALYLVLTRFLARDYSAAAAVISTCTVDIPFTAEEKWIFSKFERGENDCHPDAHACRLKLSLMVSYSDNKTPWEAHREMGAYLAKLPHVSSACRLTDNEEIAVLRLCRQATPLLKNRLDLIAAETAAEYAQKNAADAGGEDGSRGTGVVQLKGPAPRWGAALAEALLASLHYLDAYSTRVKRVR